MSICVSWSTEHGCTRCRNRRECNELGLSPFDDATDEEINALVDAEVLPESYRRDCQRQARGGDRVEAVVLPASGQELRDRGPPHGARGVADGVSG